MNQVTNRVNIFNLYHFLLDIRENTNELTKEGPEAKGYFQ